MNTCLVHYVDHQGRCNDCHELRALKAEVERLKVKLSIPHEMALHANKTQAEVIGELEADLARERERSELLRKAIDVASAVLLKGTPLKNGPVFVQGSEAEKLLNAVDSARAALLEALLAAKRDEGEE